MLLEPFSSVSAQNVWEIYGVKCGREVEDTPTVDPRRYPPTALLPHPTVAPPPTVATFEQPIAENTQFYTNFHNFFLKIFVPFLDFSRLKSRGTEGLRIVYYIVSKLMESF